MTTIKTTAAGLHPGHEGTPDAGKHQHGVNVTPLEEQIATLSERLTAQARLLNIHNDRLLELEAKAHTHAAPIPGPEPTPDPEPDEPPFLSRPMRVPYAINGGTDVVIENVTVNGRDLATRLGRAFTIQNVRNLRIVNVDQADWQGGIYLYNITGRLEIENVRSRNIGDVRPGDSTTIGSGKGNHLQLSESTVEGYITACRALGGRTEDMFSIFHSGGVSADKPLVIHHNRLQGLIADTATARAWTSNSGTGMCICDGGGSSKNGHVHVIENELLNPGQVGINIIDGPGLRILTNILAAEPYGPNNNPLTTYEGTPVGVASGNRYNWVNANGSRPTPWKHPGGSGMAFTGNVQDPSIDPKTLAVVL